MAHTGPIRSWDYLAVGTIVPASGGERAQTSCALCGGDAWMDPKGALYTAPNDCAVVCDACGDREAPQAMALVRQLRSFTIFTATVAGASLETDAWALLCPICYREQEPDDHLIDGCWHAVDLEHGRAICSDCITKIDPALVSVIEALEQLERYNRIFNSIDSEMKH
jgi:hypothetical protein